jgi:subtilase family serine protease
MGSTSQYAWDAGPKVSSGVDPNSIFSLYFRNSFWEQALTYHQCVAHKNATYGGNYDTQYPTCMSSLVSQTQAVCTSLAPILRGICTTASTVLAAAEANNSALPYEGANTMFDYQGAAFSGVVTQMRQSISTDPNTVSWGRRMSAALVNTAL